MRSERIVRSISQFFRGMSILLSVLLLPLTVAGATPALTGTETQVTNAAADQFDPAVSGNVVVYTDFSGVDADVWYTDLTTGTAYPVSTSPGDQQLTGVSGNCIVFTDWNAMEVLVYDVTTGMTTDLTNAAGSNSLDPAIGGNLAAWTDDRDGNAEIYARDLSTGGEERRITNNPLVDQSAAVGDGLIVWERCDGYACDVFVYDWATGTTRQLTDTPYATERFPDVSGRTVVFQREQGTPIDKDLVAIDLDAPGEKVLALPGDQENPHISGDFVAFNDSASGVPHIGLWRLTEGDHFQVTAGTSGQYLNDIDGNRIVYSDNRAGTLDIWMYTFSVDDAGEEGYVFGGFQKPINADGSSIFKAGRTIPVKIVLTDSNGQSVPGAVVTIAVSKIPDQEPGTEVADASGNANTDSLFRYDDAFADQFIFNLSTKGYTRGIYKVCARPDDDQEYCVNFSLR